MTRRQSAGLTARLEAYKAARDDGLDTWEAASQMGISNTTRAAYERWYRRVTGQPPRERQVPGAVPQDASYPDWRMPS